MTQLENLSKRQQARLLKYYKDSEKIIKAKLVNAIERGNDATYLRTIQREIGLEIKNLEQKFNGYSQGTLGLIYESQSVQTDKVIDSAELSVGIEPTFAKINKKAIETLSQNTQKGLKGITLNMGRQSAGTLRKLGLMTSRDIIIGSETWQTATKAMTAQLKDKGFFFVKYKLKNGNIRKVPAEIYSKMVARTTSAEAFRLSTTERIKGRGYDLVKVVGISSFPESPCIPYQGKTLSITGSTEGYISLEDARSNEFNHPNCIHTLVFSKENLKGLDDV